MGRVTNWRCTRVDCRPPTQAATRAWLADRQTAAAGAAAGAHPAAAAPRGFVMDPNTGALKLAGPLPTQVSLDRALIQIAMSSIALQRPQAIMLCWAPS